MKLTKSEIVNLIKEIVEEEFKSGQLVRYHEPLWVRPPGPPSRGLGFVVPRDVAGMKFELFDEDEDEEIFVYIAGYGIYSFFANRLEAIK
tara:strand:+ start:17138 stop:17407 length:270 start_codon:yes stop_codon:yes gene_type:complete